MDARKYSYKLIEIVDRPIGGGSCVYLAKCFRPKHSLENILKPLVSSSCEPQSVYFC